MTTFRFHPFHLRSDVDILFRGEEIIPLEPQAVRVLRYLVEHHDRIIPKRELHDAVWPGVFTTEDVLKKAVSQARRALGDETRLYIKTFHTRGYRFVAPVLVTQEIAREQQRHPDFDQLVGREAELAALLHEYEATKQRKGRPVLITGDPGIGKSQLVHYFAEEVRRDGALCLEARFSDYGAGQFAPFETFLNLLRKALAQDSGSLADTVRTRLGVTLPEELFSGARPSPSSIGDVFRAVVPICDCFVRLSGHAPLVLVLDDLHWADPSSLEVVGYLMRTAERERLMLLGAMRSEESRKEDSPIQEWLQRQAAYRAYTTLSLAPLSMESLRKTVEVVFGGPSHSPDIPPAELAQIVSISGGNPYFFAEMLRLLLAQGALTLTAEPARWAWKGTKNLRLPENFVTAARARLNGLAPEVRKLVDEAAVIGDEFRIDTLAALSGRDPTTVEELLSAALADGVLSDQRLSSGEDRRFAHTIVRRVVYDAIPHHRRRALHEQAARALQTVYATEIDRVAGAIGEHCEEAGLHEETLRWSMRAGQVAASRWQWRDAVSNLERAARAMTSGQLAADRPKPALHLQLALGDAYLSVGRLRDSERVLGSAVELANALDDEASLAAALMKLAQTRIGLSQYRDALVATERAHALYITLGDDAGNYRALVQIGTIQVAMGNYEAAGPVMEQVLANVDHDTEPAALAQGMLGWGRALQGRYAEAVPLLERAARYHELKGDLRRRALLLRRLHWIALSRGKYERAIALAVAARDGFRVAGDVNGEAKSTMAIGQVRIDQGLCEEGIAHLHKTLESLATIGDRHCEAESLWLLGRGYRHSGRGHEAEALLRRALEMIREIGDRDDEFRILIDLASTRLSLRDAASARAFAEEAVAIAQSLSNETGVALARIELARATGDAAAARAAVETLERCEAAGRWYGWWTVGIAANDADALRRSEALVEKIIAELPDAERKRIARAAFRRRLAEGDG
jgi:DNA-binding winged helix-turn-helix (wHTH) protein/tetratricopeptide (TPR) repeat protein